MRERGYVNKRLNYEDVAEYEYRPAKCRKTYRMVVVRKNISKMKGDLTLLDEIRYFFYITTRWDLERGRGRPAGQRALRPGERHRPASWVRCGSREQLGVHGDGGAGVEPKSWLAMMMHLKTDRRKYVAMEFRRFVREMILLPCQVIRRARQTTLRIIGWQPATDRLFSAWRRSSGPASGSAGLRRASVRVHGTAVPHSRNQWGKVPKFASTCHFIPRNLRHGPLCGLQVRLMPTRTAETRPPGPTRLF